MEEVRIKGKIKWFNIERKYGFISGENGQDYFVHIKRIEGYITLAPEAGTEVEFTPRRDKKGFFAREVKILDEVEKRYITREQ